MKENKGLSSSGLKILPYSPKETDGDERISAYMKAGYKIEGFVDSFMEISGVVVPLVKRKLSRHDRLSSIKVRCGIGRHRYSVAPGLYGIGSPDGDSDVLVTANFKLTFDILRTSLENVSAWILVLDTKGINVWCAAGKKIFSTDEVVKKVKETGLEKIVNHRTLILPQLSATAVSAFEVRKKSGFTVVFGPVKALYIPEFLKNGKKADKKMRELTFTFQERFVLIPVELGIALKPLLKTAGLLFLLSLITRNFSVENIFGRWLGSIAYMASGLFSGAVITPLFLPYIPFRAFAAKGLVTGAVISSLLMFSSLIPAQNYSGRAAMFIFSTMISSYLAMNFTGSTPFTSPSGVEREMKLFLPVQIIMAVMAFGLFIYSSF